jgi:hypothetical protein
MTCLAVLFGLGWLATLGFVAGLWLGVHQHRARRRREDAAERDERRTRWL